jgi:putative membrane protein
MKRFFLILLTSPLLILSCNNEAKDSIEKADSANQAKIDSPAVQPTIVTDEETASFLVKAVNGGMTEVKLGSIAQEKGTNQKVKDFGAMMVHDHSAANDRIKSLATQRNVTLPADVSDESKKDIDDISKKTGRDFDKTYINAMVKKHKATIDMFEKAFDKSNDAEVKTFINNTLPKVKEHLDSAEVIQKAIK